MKVRFLPSQPEPFLLAFPVTLGLLSPFFTAGLLRTGDAQVTRLKIFSGNANIALARAICAFLSVPLGAAVVKRFSDGEVNVDISYNFV